MNLTINGYKITLGPRAPAHVETMKSPYFEDAAKVYAQNELERWCAGGKVGPDVTISGPERFVPRYNEIGLPVMPKAGAGKNAEAKDAVAPVSAAPAEDNTVLRVAPNGIAIEPYGTLPVKGDSVFACFDDGKPAPDGYGVPDVVVGGIDGKADTASGHTFKLRWFGSAESR